MSSSRAWRRRTSSSSASTTRTRTRTYCNARSSPQLHGAREGRVALSLEQFERDVQGALDAYLSGQLDEQAFLKQARPWPNYDPDYRRLIEFCKAHGVSVCAANIPRPLASRIAKLGFDAAWAGYTPEERAWIADETIAPKDEYFTLFSKVMTGGGDGARTAACR